MSANMTPKKQDDIPVHIGARASTGPGGMRFLVGTEFTEFACDYKRADLLVARAVLLDLADAIKAKLIQIAH